MGLKKFIYLPPFYPLLLMSHNIDIKIVLDYDVYVISKTDVNHI